MRSEWFSQYLDHRTNASRTLVYVAYLIEGEMNFRTLTLLANLALPLILCLFYLCVRGEEYRWSMLLVSALLLLNLRTPALILHSQAGFAYYYVFFLRSPVCSPAQGDLAEVLARGRAVHARQLTFASGQIVWLMGLANLLHRPNAW